MKIFENDMKHRLNILLLVAATSCLWGLWGCFKDTVSYTIFRTAVQIQSQEGGNYYKARDLYTYAYYVDTTDWRIASYEDACNKVITNKLSGEKRDMPDVYGEMTPSEEYQLSMLINQPTTMMVLVDPELKVYAYRKYELPVNLANVDTKLYIAAWRRSYQSAGWRIVNEFYTEPSKEPDEPENNPEEPEQEPDNGENKDNGENNGGDDTGNGSDETPEENPENE